MSSRGITAAYLQIRFASLPYEVFACLFLDSQHRLIATEELFRGTVNRSTVHSREVVKAALRHNAAAAIPSTTTRAGRPSLRPRAKY